VPESLGILHCSHAAIPITSHTLDTRSRIVWKMANVRNPEETKGKMTTTYSLYSLNCSGDWIGQMVSITTWALGAESFSFIEPGFSASAVRSSPFWAPLSLSFAAERLILMERGALASATGLEFASSTVFSSGGVPCPTEIRIFGSTEGATEGVIGVTGVTGTEEAGAVAVKGVEGADPERGVAGFAAGFTGFLVFFHSGAVCGSPSLSSSEMIVKTYIRCLDSPQRWQCQKKITTFLGVFSNLHGLVHSVAGPVKDFDFLVTALFQSLNTFLLKGDLQSRR